tara:strand:+ start:83 stop:472 length:390 start_codon:yes stop_codon:yes gene_type:complete
MVKKVNGYLKIALRIIVSILLLLLGLMLFYAFSGCTLESLTDTQKAQVEILQTQVSAATLQNTTAQSNLQQAKSNKADAEIRLTNAQGDVKTSEIQLDKAQSDAEAAQQKLNNAEKALADYKAAGDAAP